MHTNFNKRHETIATSGYLTQKQIMPPAAEKLECKYSPHLTRVS